jgi:hypothetical protein
LAGEPSLWRLRVLIDGGEWRVIYVLDDNLQKVSVTLIVAGDRGGLQAR